MENKEIRRKKTTVIRKKKIIGKGRKNREGKKK